MDRVPEICPCVLNLDINDQLIGEIGLNAWFFGQHSPLYKQYL